jgi:MFS family permease
MGAALNSTPPQTHSPARGARLSLILLLTINLFNYIDRYVLASVEPKIREHFFPGAASHAASAKEELAAAMTKTGSLATAFLLSYMIAAPVFGWLAGRMSRWILVGISVAVWTLASGASGLAATFGILVLTRCFVGIGEAGYGPAAPSMISELYPIERRGAVLAWFYMAIPVGSALGYALGGMVIKHYSWRVPFFLVVPPGLLLATWAFFMKNQNRAALAPPKSADLRTDDSKVLDYAEKEKRPKAHLKDYIAVLKIPSYILDTLGMAAMTFAIGGFSFWMPAYLVDQRKAGKLEDVNLYFGGIMVVAGITATLLGGWLGDFFRRRTSGAYFIVSAVGILLSVVFIVLMLQTPFPAAWLWLFFAVFFLFINTGPSNTILANVTHPAVRANAFALNILIIHALGDAISPPLLGAIAGHSWDAALYVVCAVMVLASAFWFWGAAFLKRDSDRVEQAVLG